MICDNWIKITYVDLINFRLILIGLTSKTTLILVTHIIVVILPHVVIESLIVVHIVTTTIVVVCPRDTSTMGCPIKFEKSVIMSRYLLSIKSQKHIPCGIIILKLDKTIAHWFVGYFILYQLNIGDGGNLIKLHCDVILVHPGEHIADPE